MTEYENVVDQILRMMVNPENTYQPSTFAEMMIPQKGQG